MEVSKVIQFVIHTSLPIKAGPSIRDYRFFVRKTRNKNNTSQKLTDVNYMLKY